MTDRTPPSHLVPPAGAAGDVRCPVDGSIQPVITRSSDDMANIFILDTINFAVIVM
jgi:hypothetical protein